MGKKRVRLPTPKPRKLPQLAVKLPPPPRPSQEISSGGLFSFLKRPEHTVVTLEDHEQLLRKKEVMLASQAAEFERKARALAGRENSLKDREITMSQKERAFRDKDALVKETLASVSRAERRRADIAKENDLLEVKRHELEEQVGALKSRLDALQRDAGQKRALLGGTEKDLAKKYAELNHLQHRLDQREQLLETKEKVLNEKESGLLGFDQQLKRQQRELSERDKHGLSELAQLKEELARKQDLSIADVLAQNKALQRELQKRSQELAQREKQLESDADSRMKAREQELANKARKLTLREQAIDEEIAARTKSAEQDLVNRSRKLAIREQAIDGEITNRMKSAEQDLTAKKREFDKREKSIAEEELRLAQHQSELKEAEDGLSLMKEALAEELKGHMAEYAEFVAKWKTELDSLNAARSEIKKEKASITKLVQGDLRVLSEKEDELVSATKDFEKDKRKLITEENRLVERVRELERVAHQHGRVEQQFQAREKALQAYEDALGKKEDLIMKALNKAEEARKKAEELKAKIAAVKEAKADLKRLEALRSELEWTIEKESRKVIAMGGKLHHIEDRLKESKDSRVKAIEKRHEKAAKQEKKPVPHRLTPVTPPKPVETEEHVYEARAEIPEGHEETGIAAARPSEIPHLLNQAHDSLAANDLKTAKVILEKLMKIHSMLHDNDAKRTLGYEILDLKTSIKLAALS
ncbi:hypothetical protein HY493_02995 [Candidatus Woesearchaeota archaeon]|nr:hypothetical protein [Candidatus Woesearchaeota archaeon]